MVEAYVDSLLISWNWRKKSRIDGERSICGHEGKGWLATKRLQDERSERLATGEHERLGDVRLQTSAIIPMTGDLRRTTGDLRRATGDSATSDERHDSETWRRMTATLRDGAIRTATWAAGDARLTTGGGRSYPGDWRRATGGSGDLQTERRDDGRHGRTFGTRRQATGDARGWKRLPGRATGATCDTWGGREILTLPYEATISADTPTLRVPTHQCPGAVGWHVPVPIRSCLCEDSDPSVARVLPIRYTSSAGT